MTDLTAITTPFGLLDRETQAALRAHGGPFQYWAGSVWGESASKTLFDIDTALTYRVRPAPPKPREWWAVGKHLHDTEAEAVSFRQACADDHGTHHLRTPIIHVREVLE